MIHRSYSFRVSISPNSYEITKLLFFFLQRKHRAPHCTQELLKPSLGFPGGWGILISFAETAAWLLIHQTIETGEASTHPNQKSNTQCSWHQCGAVMWMRMQIWRSHGNKNRINRQPLLKIGLAQVHWTENFRTQYPNQTRLGWLTWNQTGPSVQTNEHRQLQEFLDPLTPLITTWPSMVIMNYLLNWPLVEYKLIQHKKRKNKKYFGIRILPLCFSCAIYLFA